MELVAPILLSVVWREVFVPAGGQPFDIGAVAWILRKCPWWVPGFGVDTHRAQLLEVDRIIRRDGSEA